MHHNFLYQLQQAYFSTCKPAIIVAENKTTQGESVGLHVHE